MNKNLILKIFNVYAISFMMLSNSFTIAAQGDQAQLIEAVAGVNSALSTVNSSRPSTIKYCSDCNAMAPRVDCAPETFEALDDIYTNGTVGVLNSIFGGGEFKDPRSICNSGLSSGVKPDYVQLTKDLEQKYPTMTTLKDFANGCFDNSSIEEYIESGRKKTDLELSKAYVAMDFHVKNQKIADENVRLFEAKNQLANLIDVSPSNCAAVKDRAARSRCEDLLKCNNKKKDELVNAKAEELNVAIKSIQTLNDQLWKLNIEDANGMGIPNPENNEKRKILQQNIEVLMDLNPALKSDDFKSLKNQFRKISPIDISKVKSAYIKTLKSSAKKIDERIKKLDVAQRCVFGEESKCSDSNKLLANLKYKDANKIFIEKEADGKVVIREQLNLMNNFYTCIENSIESRNKADDVLDEVAVTLAITIATFGAGAVISGGASLLKLATAATRAKNIATLATTGTDLLYAGAVGANNYAECTELENEIKTFSQAPTTSCEDVTVNMYKSSNMNRCYLSAALSTAGIAAGGALAVKLLKVPRTTMAPKVAQPTVAPSPKAAPVIIEELPLSNPGIPRLDKTLKPTTTEARVITQKSDDVIKETMDSAGNTWKVNQTNKKVYINGEEAIFQDGGTWRFKTASGKIYDYPLNTIDAPIAIAAPKATGVTTELASREVSTVQRELATFQPNRVEKVVEAPKIPQIADDASITLSRAADDIPAVRFTKPRTAGAASASAIAANQLATNISTTNAPSSEGQPIVEGPTTNPETPADPQTPTEPETPTKEDPAVLPENIKDLIKFRVSSDDCSTTIKADLKDAKAEHADISCKYSTCSEEKYKEDKSKCQSEAFDKKGNEFDRKEKGYFLYPICKITKGEDVAYSYIKLADDKVKKILVNSYDEMVSCKPEKEMKLPNLVIPDSAPNVGNPQMMQAPAAPVLIEY